MKAIDVINVGASARMEPVTLTSPIPQTGEILIKVDFAGVNRPDVIQRQGLYPPPAGASSILGLEVSGTVVAVGENVDQWQKGDQLCALTHGGGYAEYVCVDARHCLPIPIGLSLKEAAGLPETCFTVWSNLFDRAGLVAGETVLIHGGASGIGTTAIQMAKAMGVTVFVTASSDAKCLTCYELGADAAINYHADDFVERVKTFTDGRGVDVILDMVGGDYMQRNMSAAAIDGRIVNIAYLRGSKAELNMMPVMLKRLTLTGSTLRPQSAHAKAKISEKLLKYIWPLIEAGKIRPLIAATFPLEQVNEAHQLMESNQLMGKIILSVGS